SAPTRNGFVSLCILKAMNVLPRWRGKPSVAQGTPNGRQAICLVPDLLSLQSAAPHLVELDRLEERLEVALAEALVALPLDELEEDRPELVLGEDLQEQRAGLAVHEDLAFFQLRDVFAVAGDALVDELVVRVDG